MMKRIIYCNQHPQPEPNPLPLPQQHSKRMIQMMLSHPQPQLLSLLLNKPLLPPQQHSKRMIQIMELHPHPLLLFPHPHPVAVKSLIYCLQKVFVLWFIICGMACMCFLENIKNFYLLSVSTCKSRSRIKNQQVLEMIVSEIERCHPLSPEIMPC